MTALAIAGTIRPMDAWGFLWLMIVLKIPLAMLLWLVWWSIRQPPEYADEEPRDDGGSKSPHDPPARPRRRPRGPHGDPAPLPAPPRVRTVARGRSVEKRQ